MAALALAALYALFVWWFSTGAILFLDGLPPRSFRWSMAGATVLLAAAAYGIAASRGEASPAGAYIGFTSGLVVWAWLEMTYYMGFVTGPRRRACAPGCSGPRHFGHAVMSSLYHELATIGLAAALYAATRGMPNTTGLWTFVILWGMQVSAKLNVFLGVPNVSEEFLPDHLAFLKGFLNQKPMNLLFPVSVTGSVVLATLLVQKAVAAPAGGFEAAGASLLAVLTVLAVLEHWFLVLPLRAAALWTWSLLSRDNREAGPAEPKAVDPVRNSQPCPVQAHATHARPGWPAGTLLDKLFSDEPAARGLADPSLLQPAQPSMARRPR